MKKLLILLLALLYTLLPLSACSFHLSRQSQADSSMEQFLRSLNNRDREAVKASFSPSIVSASEDFDQEINALFAYYQGEQISLLKNASGSSEQLGSNPYHKYKYSYNVETTEGVYCIAALYVLNDWENAEDEGILSFFIIRAEDFPDYPKYAYWGDGNLSPGLYLGKYC